MAKAKFERNKKAKKLKDIPVGKNLTTPTIVLIQEILKKYK